MCICMKPGRHQQRFEICQLVSSEWIWPSFSWAPLKLVCAQTKSQYNSYLAQKICKDERTCPKMAAGIDEHTQQQYTNSTLPLFSTGPVVDMVILPCMLPWGVPLLCTLLHGIMAPLEPIFLRFIIKRWLCKPGRPVVCCCVVTHEILIKFRRMASEMVINRRTIPGYSSYRNLRVHPFFDAS